MKIRIVILAPESKKGSFSVNLPIVVGRSGEAKFRIQQDRVSRKHCEFFAQDGVVFVRDLGSTNGTFLENNPLPSSTKLPVSTGATMRIGSLTFRVEYDTGKSANTTEILRDIPEAAEVTTGCLTVAESLSDNVSDVDVSDIDGVNFDSMPGPDAQLSGLDLEKIEPENPAAVAEDVPAFEDLPSGVAVQPDAMPAALAQATAEPAFEFLMGEQKESAEEIAPWSPADGEAEVEAPDDDKLGDFFKGLQ
ncbi:MAG: hypothetical protein CK530_05490 [Planctomycetaceae bacterium]|nr:MAG: hypothetical protein CK530_05490 [Planctomycetaceae bacterium]